MAQHRRNGPAVVARSGRRHWQRGQGRWGCSETHACVVRRRTHRRGWLSAAEVQDGAHRGCRPSSECGGVGPSLGRPRTLNGGQQRPTTTTRRTSPHRLTSENPAHQDPRQDPGQEEVRKAIMSLTCAYGADRGHFRALGPRWVLSPESHRASWRRWLMACLRTRAGESSALEHETRDRRHEPGPRPSRGGSLGHRGQAVQRVPGCPGARVSGCPGVRVPGCPGVRVRLGDGGEAVVPGRA